MEDEARRANPSVRGGRRAGPAAWAHLVAWVLLAAVGALLFARSWQRWGHPIIDLGRDLYVPSQIRAGRVLYRQVLYNYGPAAPYLLAGTTAVLGDGLWVFEAAGVAAGLATMAALYLLVLRLAASSDSGTAGRPGRGIAAGFAAALLFLVMNFFANSTWGCNYVLPYAYAATFGMAFALWSFYFLLRYLYAGRRRATLAASVTLLFLAVLSKQEIGLAIALTHGAAWWAHGVSRRAILSVAAAGIGVGLLMAALFAARGPHEHALLAENLAKFGTGLGDPFFRRVAGLDRPGAHLARMALSLTGLAALLACSQAAEALRLLRARRWAAAGIHLAAGAAGLGLIGFLADPRLFAAAVPGALAVAAATAWRQRRHPALLVSVFVLGSALRLPLAYHPLWYGFALSVPVYVFAVWGLGVWGVGRLRRPGAARIALALLAAVLMGRFTAVQWQRYGRMRHPLRTRKGTLRDFPAGGRAEAIGAFLDYMAAQGPERGAGMVVFPEGASLNYFTGIVNPTAYTLFIPPEIPSAAVEERMVAELERAAPRWVVITSRDVREFGRGRFGVGYGLRLRRWIGDHYALERRFGGGEGRPWRLFLLRRRPVVPGGAVFDQ